MDSGMTTFSSKFVEDFMGPSCLYHMMNQRLKSNPCLLKRNVLHPQSSMRKLRKLVVDFKFDTLPPSGYLTFHVASKIESDAHFQVIFTGGITISSDPNLDVAIKIPMRDPIDSPSCQHIFLLVLISNSGHGKEAHDRWTSSICKAASENLGMKGRQEILEIQLPCHAIVIDLGQFAQGAHSLTRHDFRTFMFPSSSSLQQGQLSKVLRCRFNVGSSSTKKPKVSSASSSSTSQKVDDERMTCSFRVLKKYHAYEEPKRKATTMDKKSVSHLPSSSYSSMMTSHVHSLAGVDRVDHSSLMIPHTTPSVIPKHGAGTCILAECNGNVIYHCGTVDVDRQHRIWYERRGQFRCIWCDISFARYFNDHSAHSEMENGQDGRNQDVSPRRGSLKAIHALAYHLHTCHDHFKYDLALDAKGCLHVIVQRNILTTPTASFIRNQLTADLLIMSQESDRVMHQEIAKVAKTLSQQSHGMLAKKQDHNVLKSIDHFHFFHPTTGQPMTKQDFDSFLNSRENLDYDLPELDMNSYDLKENYKLLEEYVDINVHEKKFMKLWNAHLHAFPPYGDTLLVLVCERFVQKYGMILIQERLRYNWLLHLLSLWDFGLVTAEEVRYLVEALDHVKHSQEALA